MSWSISAIGKPLKVAEKLEIEFKRLTNLTKPEDEIAAAIGEVLIKTVKDTTDVIIKVVANGSMGYYGSGHTHSINITVESIFGFVE